MKKKPIFISVLSFLSLVLSGCSQIPFLDDLLNKLGFSKKENETEIKHNFSEKWESDENNHWHACLDDGCKELSDLSQHTFGEWIVSAPASCTYEGERYRLCEVCGYKETDIIPMLDHVMGNEWKSDATGHWHVCEDCDEKLDFFEHDFGEWVIDDDPTCTEEGLKHHSCKDCGYVVNEVIEAKGHHFAEEWTIDDEATCSHVGSMSHHCLDCDEKSDITPIPTNDVHAPLDPVMENVVEAKCTEEGSYDSVVYCDDCGEMLSSTHVVVPAKGHTYGEWDVTLDATAVSEGSKTHICSECGHEETVVIPMLVCHFEIINLKLYLISEEGQVQKNLVYQGVQFDENGVGQLNQSFFEFDGHTYYFIELEIVFGFHIINNTLYYFDDDGYMAQNVTITDFDLDEDDVNDSISFDANGHAYVINILIIILDGHSYLLNGATLVMSSTISLNIFESDSDLNDANNPSIEAYYHIWIRDQYFEGRVGADGQITIENVEFGHATIEIYLNGYNTRTFELNIDKAEVELNAALDLDVSNGINGGVHTATGNLNIPNAEVTVIRLGDTVEPMEPMVIYTDEYGNYSISGLTAGVYQLTVYVNGYEQVVSIVHIRFDVSTTTNDTISAFTIEEAQEESGTISGKVSSATTTAAVEGLTVKFRKGVGVDFGEVLYSTTTDSSGNYTMQVTPGNYTVQAVDEREGLSEGATRYAAAHVNVRVMPNGTVSGTNILVSPIDNNIRIVLTWGSMPSDLDSHTYFEGGTHISYSNKTTNYGSLDVDDTSSYGPETTTITANKSFVFFVHDYSDSSGFYANANARVAIYVRGELYTTRTQPSSPGSYRNWKVFSYNATTGRFTFYNVYTSSNGTISEY